MANKIPFLLTGANAKVKMNGVTIAMITNLSYNVTIPHFVPKVLGVYEGDTVEPLGYGISGSFSVIRYLQGLDITKGPSGLSDSGNGTGAMTKYKSGAGSVLAKTVGRPGDSKLQEALNPNKFKDSMGFDIEVYQKLPNGESSPAFRIRGARITSASGSLEKRAVYGQTFNFTAQYFDDDSVIADPSGQGQFEG